MQRNTSIAIIAAIVVVIGVLSYFVFQPLLNNINLGLDLRGGLRVVLEAQETEGEKVTPILSIKR